jgi:hypothetical protein
MAAFPPTGPTTVTAVLPAYLYEQFADDDDLQAFVAAFNALAQQYVDWFVQIGLPIYTGPNIIGALLDWVAQGLYGIARPTLAAPQPKTLGPFNTYRFGQRPPDIGGRTPPPSTTFSATTDDVFKRIITWHFYKGDGKVFSIPWLKRRIMRFLAGVNGTAPFNTTYQVSVSFGASGQVHIVLRSLIRTISGGCIVGRALVGGASSLVDSLQFTVVAGVSLTLAPQLAEALASGALELPFQISSNLTVTSF